MFDSFLICGVDKFYAKTYFMVKKYKLIREDNNKKRFEQEVTKALNEGWVTLGAPSISFHKEVHLGSARLIEAYLQAMIKETDDQISF